MENQNQSIQGDIYQRVPLSEIPWNNEQPPELLVELIETGKVTPCRAIDLGCGAGNYAAYLAAKGFNVTGVDMSPTAIKFARQNAKQKGVKCKFLVGDVIEHLSETDGRWDFAYDWGLLHHIFPENRQKYVQGVHNVLNPGGKYLSVCFNEKDTAFARLGEGAAQTKEGIYTSNTSSAIERIETPSRSREGTEKYRKTKLSSTVYLSCEIELRELFDPFFEIIDFRVLEIKGKIMTHIFNYCFMSRK